MPMLIHTQIIECIVQSRDGILRKFMPFRVARGNMEAEPTCALAEQEKENQKRTLPFRYSDSPKEIQGASLEAIRH